uniref:PLOD1-3-like GT domain-containing protein n=1 Tax=Ditylenchus dipsaci TaxID=166011 RepID=A0A915DHH9_9BILA
MSSDMNCWFWNGSAVEWWRYGSRNGRSTENSNSTSNLEQHKFKDRQNTMIMLWMLTTAEPFCWPDRTLAPEYPLVTFGERFLNSGMFIGFIDDVMEMLVKYSSQLQDSDDDQLFYAKLYLDKDIRSELKIGLDSLSRIFKI